MESLEKFYCKFGTCTINKKLDLHQQKVKTYMLSNGKVTAGYLNKSKRRGRKEIMLHQNNVKLRYCMSSPKNCMSMTGKKILLSEQFP